MERKMSIIGCKALLLFALVGCVSQSKIIQSIEGQVPAQNGGVAYYAKKVGTTDKVTVVNGMHVPSRDDVNFMIVDIVVHNSGARMFTFNPNASFEMVSPSIKRPNFPLRVKGTGFFYPYKENALQSLGKWSDDVEVQPGKYALRRAYFVALKNTTGQERLVVWDSTGGTPRQIAEIQL